MDVLKGKVVVAGQVKGADGMASRGISLWDGTRWTSLEGGLEGRGGHASIRKVYLTEKSIYALGEGGNLFLNGQRFDAARWDGSGWKGWKVDSSTLVYDVVHWNGQELFCTSDGVLAVDSSGLIPFGTNLEGEVHQFGKKDAELWVAGRFRLRPDSSLQNLARWTGSSWVGLSSPRSGYIRDFSWHKGELFSIETRWTGMQDSQSVWKWNGAQWSAPPGVPTLQVVQTLESDSQRLLLSGHTPELGIILEWDGTRFNRALAFDNENAGHTELKLDSGRLYLSGAFVRIDSLRAEGVASWNGSRWMSLSKAENLGPTFGERGGVPFFAAHGGKLYFGGGGILFTREQPAGGLCSWDGNAFDNLGGGLNTVRRPRTSHLKVTDMVFAGEKIYVGGAFDSAGAREARNIAAWDGRKWEPLGGGYPGTVTDILAVGSDLFVSGEPDTAPSPGSNPLLVGQALARWDGAAWHKFGEGIAGWVTFITTYQGEMYIGGAFTLPADSGYCGLAKWDGSNWLPIIRSGQNRSLFLDAALVHQDELFLSGTFPGSEASPSYLLARWNGNRLAPFDSIQRIGAGPLQWVSHQSRLILTGSVKGRSDRLIYWDGNQWHTIVEDEYFNAYLLAEYAGDLYVYGNPSYLDGTVAYRLVKWKIPATHVRPSNPVTWKGSEHRLMFREGSFRILSPAKGRAIDLSGRSIPTRKPL